MHFLLRLFQTENINRTNYRFYFANRYAYIISGFTHLTFIPIFYYLNLTVLALYNFFSILVFVLAYYLNEKGHSAISTIPVSIEILFHAVLAIYFIGWESGFFYYILAIIPLVFSNPTSSNIQKIAITTFIASFYLSLKYYANTHVPLVQLEQNTLNNLYFMNSFSIIVGISALVHFFSLASDITESKIDKERDEADQANQAKSTFLANMSHELRTPLNAIIGYSEMLKDDADEQGNKQSSKDLSRITKAGSHLLELINNILDLTKIEAGKTELEYRPTDISPLMNDVISAINPQSTKRNNTLTINCVDDFGYVSIDQTKVKQILINLLSNACKFTDNGNIELSVYKEESESQEWICFKICDSGIGIPENKLDVLFQPFMQADISTTRIYGGTGLGLTISKHFITLMEGSINVESIVDEGTTFLIKLPIKHTSLN